MPKGRLTHACVDRRGWSYPNHRYEGAQTCRRCGKLLSQAAQYYRDLKAARERKARTL